MFLGGHSVYYTTPPCVRVYLGTVRGIILLLSQQRSMSSFVK